jgi:heterodisulfide reductase subunit C
MGYESELVRDKDIIWQCVSCHKCTHICPRDVEPEGVMKATALWLEAKGYTPPSPSHVFDAEFSRQVFERGKIEDVEVLANFMKATKQPLMQDWLVRIARNIAMRLPVKWGLRSLWALVRKPRTRGWARSRLAIEDYIREEDAKRAEMLARSRSVSAGGRAQAAE